MWQSQIFLEDRKSEGYAPKRRADKEVLHEFSREEFYIGMAECYHPDVAFSESVFVALKGNSVPLRIQFLTHPVGLLGAMFVGDVVADVIAIFEHPEFGFAARLCRDTLALFGGDKPIVAALNDEQGTVYFIRYTL